MKEVVKRYRENKAGNKKYFYKGYQITEEQAKAVKAIGGRVVTARTDQWYWDNWS
jgi:hypothetical protein